MHFNYPHSQRKKNLSAQFVQSPIPKVLSVFSLLNSDDLKQQVLDFTNSYLRKKENLQDAVSDKHLPSVFRMKDFVSRKSTRVSTHLWQDTLASYSEPWPMELSGSKCCWKSAGCVEWAKWPNDLRCSSGRIGTESGSPGGDTQPLPLTSSVTLVGYQVKLYFILFLLIVEIMWLRAAVLQLLMLVQ